MSELDNVNCNMSAIPSFASVNESGYYTLNAIEEDYNTMVKSIGLNELGLFEAKAPDMIAIKDDRNIRTKIVDFFKKAWAYIKGLFEKFLNAISSAIDKLTTKLRTKMGSAAKLADFNKRIAYLQKNKANMKFGKTRDWSTLLEYTGNPNANSEIMDKYHVVEDADDEETFHQSMLKLPGTTMQEWAKDVLLAHKKDTTDIDIKYVAAHAEEIFKGSLSLDSYKTTVKKSYNESKKEIDAKIKNVKGQKDDITKLSIAKWKYQIQLLSAANSASLTLLNERCRDYMRVVIKVSMSGKLEDDKVKKESYVGTSYQNEVASLFDWDI